MTGERIDMTPTENEINNLEYEVSFLRDEVFNLWKMSNREMYDSFTDQEVRILKNFMSEYRFDIYRPENFMSHICKWSQAILQSRTDQEKYGADTLKYTNSKNGIDKWI